MEGRAFKVLILGETGVGKTSIVQRFLFRKFSEGGPPAGRDEEKKSLRFKNGKEIELLICDTAGQGRVDLLTGAFYKDIHAIIFVYDISNSRSLWNSDKWIHDWQLHIENVSAIPVLFVGNKCDIDRMPLSRKELLDHDDISDQEGERIEEQEEEKKDFVEDSMVKVITKRNNFLPPLKCSAKSGKGVDNVFETIARRLAHLRPDSAQWKCVCL